MKKSHRGDGPGGDGVEQHVDVAGRDELGVHPAHVGGVVRVAATRAA